MSILVADCPRCKAEKMTFDAKHALQVGVQYSWQRWFEIYCICRNCTRSVVFVTSQHDLNSKEIVRNTDFVTTFKDSLNKIFNVERYISLRDEITFYAPEHIPEDIKAAFNEATTCLAVQCWNAAGTMFRQCVDLATKPLLPKDEVEGLSKKQRRDLGLRLPWLFANNLLPQGLHDLSSCIREDGNDGAHDGTLKKEDAEDLLDFTTALLERLFTEPAKLKLAAKRRESRRKPA